MYDTQPTCFLLVGNSGSWIASGSHDRTVKIWRSEENAIVEGACFGEHGAGKYLNYKVLPISYVFYVYGL